MVNLLPILNQASIKIGILITKYKIEVISFASGLAKMLTIATITCDNPEAPPEIRWGTPSLFGAIKDLNPYAKTKADKAVIKSEPTHSKTVFNTE